MGKRTILVLITAVIAVVYGYQYYLYRSETVRLERRLGQGEDLFRKVRMLEKKKPDLTKRIEALKNDVWEMRSILPPSLEIDRFIEIFEKVAGTFGVEVLDSHHEEEERDFYLVSRIRFRLAGTEEGVESVRNRLDMMARVVKWVEWKPADDGHDLLVEIYAIPFPEEKEGRRGDILPATPAERESRVWIWPLKGKVEEAVKRLRAIRIRLKEHAEILELDAELRDRQSDLKKRIELITQLRHKR